MLHFLLIGAALFALFYQVADPETVSDNRIIISETDIDRMITLFERKLQRLPTQQELNGLVEAQIREEVLYRPRRAFQLVRDLLYRQPFNAGENEDLPMFWPELLQ